MKNFSILSSLSISDLPCYLQIAIMRMSKLWTSELVAWTLEYTRRRLINWLSNSSRNFWSRTSSTSNFRTVSCSVPIASIKVEDYSYYSKKSRIESTCKDTSPQASSLRATALNKKLAICLFLVCVLGSNFNTSRVRKCSSSKFLHTYCSSAF